MALLVVTAVVIPATWVLTGRRLVSWDTAVVTVARALGVGHVPRSGSRRAEIRGTVDGVEIVVDRRALSDATRIRATGRQPPSLRIRRAALGIGVAFGWVDVETGDPDFDLAVVVDGEAEDVLRSRLDAETRRAVLRAVSRGAVLADGGWTLEVVALTDPIHLENLTRDVLDAALALAAAGDPDRRLMRIVSADPVLAVRQGALQSLIARRPAPDVLRTCLSDREPSIRRAAALGIAALDDYPGRAEAEVVLVALLPDPEVIAALGRIGTVGSIPSLTRLVGLGLTPSERQARSAIREIQSRLVGVERGAVALAAPVGRGDLSIS